MVPFAGYDMPVQYKSVIAESNAVRQGAGMFDVSHMARVRFNGGDTLAFLEKVTANDVSALEDGGGQYSLLTNENGGVVDDIIVYRVSQDEFFLVVNAANHDKDVQHMLAHMPGTVSFVDETDDTFMVAVQGPSAADTVKKLADKPETVDAMKMFDTAKLSVGGVPVFAARSGYTGEDGFELIGDAAKAVELWNALAQQGVANCGLGARDVLRVEAGLPLYGHELTDETNPIEAGLGWVVSKQGKEFLGSEMIYKARDEGTARRLIGIRMEGRRIPQPEATVRADGKPVGEMTSGVYSPLLERGIGFAYLERDVKTKTPCTVEIRGKEEPGAVTGRRFFKRT